MEIVLIARARVAQRIKWNNVGPWSLRGSKCTADTTQDNFRRDMENILYFNGCVF